jgi:hypothetical protein
MAVGQGFEPRDGINRQRFSRPSHSTTLPAHHKLLSAGRSPAGVDYTVLKTADKPPMGLKTTLVLLPSREPLLHPWDRWQSEVASYRTVALAVQLPRGIIQPERSQ